jgi:hypothetical protein
VASPTRPAGGLALALLLTALVPAVRSGPSLERPVPAHGGSRLLYGAPLDLNREPAEVLALLPGLGPMRAAAVVAGRPYCTLDDLARVPGIGPVTLRRLAGHVHFPRPPAPCADPALRIPVEGPLRPR